MWRAQAMANRRHRNNDGANENANAIHRMVDATQPIVAQLRVMMEDFMHHKLAKFTGKATRMRQMRGCVNVRTSSR